MPLKLTPELYKVVSFHADAFRSTDFRMLLNLLSPLAHKWDLLAVQLEFTYDEIENIRTKVALIPKAPQSYLQELIGLWLKRGPPKSILSEALKSDSVMELEIVKRLN